jgi:hypothetical protein
VEAIDPLAFVNSGICEIEIAKDNRHLRLLGDDGLFLNFDGTSLLRYFGPGPCVELSREIDFIGDHAFSGLEDLSDVIFPDDSNLKYIGRSAFRGCYALRSITIPASVERLDGRIFVGSNMQFIDVAPGNRHFRVSEADGGCCLVTFDGKSLIQHFHPVTSALFSNRITLVPREIEVICRFAFPCAPYSRVEFPVDSHLRRLEPSGFAGPKSVYSICIPPLVDTLDGRAFWRSKIREIRVADGNHHFRVLGGFLLTTEGTSLVRYFGRDRIVPVINEIERFGPYSFAESKVYLLSFDSDSQLRRIDSRVFFRCSRLRRLEIPPSVDSIDGSAFAACGIPGLCLAEGNGHFRLFESFLLDFQRTTLVAYLGLDSDVSIGRDVEVISDGSFSYCDTIRSMTFESPSKLRSIGRRAFAKCANLESICIPKSTVSLGESCFLICKSLREVRVASGSQLRLIEAGSFQGCSELKSVAIPRSVKRNRRVDLSGASRVEIVWTE